MMIVFVRKFSRKQVIPFVKVTKDPHATEGRDNDKIKAPKKHQRENSPCEHKMTHQSI